MNSETSQTYPFLPLRSLVIFPGVVTSLIVGRPRSVASVNLAMEREEGSRRLVVSAQKDPEKAEPGADDIYRVGTLCEILQILRLPEGTTKLLVEGQERVEIERSLSAESSSEASGDGEGEEEDEGQPWLVESRPYQPEGEGEPAEADPESDTSPEEFLAVFKTYLKTAGVKEKNVIETLRGIDDPSGAMDLVAGHLDIPVEDKQKLLEDNDPVSRQRFIVEWLLAQTERVELQRQVEQKTRERLEKHQKDFFLNEQIRVIKDELGESEDDTKVFREKIDKAGMPRQAKEKALNEVKRLEKIPSMSPESGVVRHYLEWLTELPWRKVSRDQQDIDKARQILDERHYGLEKVKDRLLEFIAVSKLTAGNDIQQAPILCLAGPPGVGKTSLAKSLAEVLGRRFIRIPLGGLRDEAEIRGHRRTYVGAMPGKIIQGIRRAGTRNPLILLDEIDKMGMDMRGDPASALLEVLDPEQNLHFQDHFLEVSFNLNRVIFVTTANSLHPVPPPLLDRMEVLSLTGYLDTEKKKIARQFLIPKREKSNGLEPGHITISDSALDGVINGYTREAGVRQLERQLDKLMRKAARRVVEDENAPPLEVEPASLRQLLGPRVYFPDAVDEEPRQIGLVNGLAWTQTGGTLLQVEVVSYPGKGDFQFTGNLGDVMRESATTALSWLRHHLARHLTERFFKEHDFHIHVPEGAIPKDGPSAGVTLATGLYSLIQNKAVRQDVAMTGEITLRGRVLPIGGVKEKSMAALRAGIREVIIPGENEKDLDELPQELREQLVFHPVRKMEEILEIMV